MDPEVIKDDSWCISSSSSSRVEIDHFPCQACLCLYGSRTYGSTNNESKDAVGLKSKVVWASSSNVIAESFKIVLGDKQGMAVVEEVVGRSQTVLKPCSDTSAPPFEPNTTNSYIIRTLRL